MFSSGRSGFRIDDPERPSVDRPRRRKVVLRNTGTAVMTVLALFVLLVPVTADATRVDRTVFAEEFGYIT